MAALCATAAADDFSPIVRYLSQFGVPATLPALHVTYDNRSKPLALHGAATWLITHSQELREPPRVEWPKSLGKIRGAKFTLFFIDLGPDTGGAGVFPRNKTFGPFFPFIHSLWTNCENSLSTCAETLKPYLAPGNPSVVPNRYTYILFRHMAELVLDGERAVPKFLDPKQSGRLSKVSRAFSFRKLFEQNLGMEAVAFNFANVHIPVGHPNGKVKVRRKKGRRRRMSI